MNERIETPRPLTHAESDFPSVRGNRNQAVISRGKMQLVCAVVAVTVLLVPGVSSALPQSSDDLWEISQGSVVGNHSAVKPGWSINAIFGPGETLLAESQSTGFVHFVEWQTPSPVTLRSFSLWAQNEGMTRRAFSQFILYSDSGGTWEEVYNTGPGFDYTGWVNIEGDVTPAVTAQDFRAEFVQASWTSWVASGPRIWELDGFDTFLDGSVPEPATLSLLALGGLALLRKRRKQ